MYLSLFINSIDTAETMIRSHQSAPKSRSFSPKSIDMLCNNRTVSKGIEKRKSRFRNQH